MLSLLKEIRKSPKDAQTVAWFSSAIKMTQKSNMGIVKNLDLFRFPLMFFFCSIKSMTLYRRDIFKTQWCSKQV